MDFFFAESHHNSRHQIWYWKNANNYWTFQLWTRAHWLNGAKSLGFVTSGAKVSPTSSPAHLFIIREGEKGGISLGTRLDLKEDFQRPEVVWSKKKHKTQVSCTVESGQCCHLHRLNLLQMRVPELLETVKDKSTKSYLTQRSFITRKNIFA